jgi:hypothetical protein
MVEIGSIWEPERHVRDAKLGLECCISGHAPVQTEGRIAGHPFYFRARHCGWSFILCTNADIDASALAPGKEPGFFTYGEFHGFALWGDYGIEHEASYMPYAVAERLIRECAARYFAERETVGSSAP